MPKNNGFDICWAQKWPLLTILNHLSFPYPTPFSMPIRHVISTLLLKLPRYDWSLLYLINTYDCDNWSYVSLKCANMLWFIKVFKDIWTAGRLGWTCYERDGNSDVPSFSTKPLWTTQYLQHVCSSALCWAQKWPLLTILNHLFFPYPTPFSMPIRHVISTLLLKLPRYDWSLLYLINTYDCDN